MPKVLHIRVDSIAGASAAFSVNSWTDKSIRTTIQEQLGVPVAEQCLVLKDNGLIISDDDWVDDADDTFDAIVEGFDETVEEATLELSLFKRNEELVKWLQDVKNNDCEGDELKDAPEAVRSSREIFVAAAKRLNSQCFQYATEDLKADAQFVRRLIHISKSGEVLLGAAASIKDNREIVLDAVSHTGETLGEVSDAFKSDQEIVLAAVKSSTGSAFEFASELLRSNRQFAMKAVQVGGNALGYVSAELQQDKNLNLEAVKCTGAALGWAFHFQDDKDVVLAAVGNYGLALEMADESLTADREVVKTAVLKDGNAMQYASAELRNDKDFAFSMIMQSKYAVAHVGKLVTEDKSCMAEVICLGEQCDPDYKKGDPGFTPLEYVSSELQADKELVLKAVWHNGYNFQYASEHLKADREVAIQAMRSPVGWRVWDVVPPSLYKDKIFAVEVVRLEDRVREEFLEFFGEDELTQST